ncbi:hypothetical protein SLEP1_g35061 [Rubroshorea leprosula]|uniref:Uncharacterized protein n=1 Tax=Rubroshorea leprosula TaxID=152421 RepID=A0AAV5KM23_9ROSI|nr:hypothetical protein SLEP1_g35061 [Rubroshorea leprosula]
MATSCMASSMEELQGKKLVLYDRVDGKRIVWVFSKCDSHS